MAVTDTVLASTLQKRSSGYSNIISAQIPLFMWLKMKGRYIAETGGTKLEWPLEIVLDTTEASYFGADTIPVKFSDSVILAEANWKQYARSIAWTGLEKRINGNKKTFDLLSQKETNALESIQQAMNEHMYQDGTGNNSKRITGLKAIISTTPTTGTLFNVSRDNVVPWRNRKIDTNDFAFDTSTKVADMVNDMNLLRIQCGRQKIGGKENRFPDLILCTETYYDRYQQVLQHIGQRFVDTKVGDAGFEALKYLGATLLHDEDMPADAGSDAQAYFINSRFLKFHYHTGANFSVTPTAEAREQDAFDAKIIWMGELVATNLGKHGLHEGVKAVGTSG